MGETKTNVCVVCDAGPIIHLDELGCLKLLEDFKEILLPKTVLEEVERHRPLILKKSRLSLNICSPKFPLNEPLKTMCRTFSLDAGEIEALAVMEQNPTSLFLTDDASARLVADRMGYKVHGSIGILIRSIRRDQMSVDQALRVLEEVPGKSTLYIKSSLLKTVIRRIKEEYRLL